jgi:hypothetical protein
MFLGERIVLEAYRAPPTAGISLAIRAYIIALYASTSNHHDGIASTIIIIVRK